MAATLDCGLGSGVALTQVPLWSADGSDCLFFLWNEAGFSPASYSQTLGKLREYLVKSGIPAGQAQQHTLHSLKTTFLSYMSQLSIPACRPLSPGAPQTTRFCAALF